MQHVSLCAHNCWTTTEAAYLQHYEEPAAAINTQCVIFSITAASLVLVALLQQQHALRRQFLDHGGVAIGLRGGGVAVAREA